MFVHITQNFSVNKMEKNKRAGRVAIMGDWSVLYRVLVELPEGDVPLGRLKPRRENMIKMDFQEVKCSGMS
jgi:hypothetical protein